MDEPLGALNKQLREQMQLDIKHIHEDLGVIVVYPTHDQGEALTMRANPSGCGLSSSCRIRLSVVFA